jgi:hypothetical protein
MEMKRTEMALLRLWTAPEVAADPAAILKRIISWKFPIIYIY